MTVMARAIFADEIEALPPLPSIVHDVMMATRSSTTTANDLAKILHRDSAIAAKVLRVVNSPFYGRAREVMQMTRAVLLLGPIAVQNLVIGFCVRDALASGASNLPEHEATSNHSIAVASTCELIAQHVNFKPVEEAFVAGLLHDIGQLAMIALRPKDYCEVLRQRKQGCGDDLASLERRVFGIDHNEAGFRLLSRWKLPKALCEVAGFRPGDNLKSSTDSTILLAIVALADIYVQTFGIGLDLSTSCRSRAVEAASILGLSESDQLRILHGLDRFVQHGMEAFTAAEDTKTPAAGTTLRRAIWVSANGGPAHSISVILLERFGYDIQHVPRDRARDDACVGDLILIDLPATEAKFANELASELATKHATKIFLLSDPREGEPDREQTPGTSVFRLPRLFTAFDLRWVEEQLAR